jgi:hypothetical protein
MLFLSVKHKNLVDSAPESAQNGTKNHVVFERKTQNLD